METLDPRIQLNLAKIGLYFFAHLMITANRIFIRPIVNSPRYNTVSLHVEHVLAHATLTMAAEASSNFFLNDPALNLLVGTITSLGKAVIWDAVKPDKPQIDQLASDVIGTAVYALPAALL